MAKDSPLTEPPPCSQCRAQDTVGILYGFPSPETVEAIERGEIPGVTVGGCVVHDDNPVWACPICKHRW